MLRTQNFTAGNKIKFTVDYSDWLDEGTTITAFTVTSDTADMVVSGVVINPTGTVAFYVAGGTVGEVATMRLAMTDTRSNLKHDTVILTVVAP